MRSTLLLKLRKFFLILLLIAWVATTSPVSITRTANLDTSWLQPETYAEYSPTGKTQIIQCYNASLDSSNASLWKNGGFDEFYLVDLEGGESFTYRWEVTARSGINITLHIFINATNWLVDEFDVTINTETSEAYIANQLVGYSCLWLADEQIPLYETIVSNPAISFEVSQKLPPAGGMETIQGFQPCWSILGEEEDFRPPQVGSRTRYQINLNFDADNGLLFHGSGGPILPVPPEARLVDIGGSVWLVETNIDLGPPAFNPANLLPGFLIVGVMAVLIMVLTIVIYVARQRRPRRRVKRVKRRR